MTTLETSGNPPESEVVARHPNAMLLADHLGALGRAAIAEAMSFYADDVVFHYPGSKQLSGDDAGKASGA